MVDQDRGRGGTGSGNDANAARSADGGTPRPRCGGACRSARGQGRAAGVQGATGPNRCATRRSDALELARNAAELQQADDASGKSGETTSPARWAARISCGRCPSPWADRLEESRTLFEAARKRVLEQGDEFVSADPALSRDNRLARGRLGGRDATKPTRAMRSRLRRARPPSRAVAGGGDETPLAHLGQVDDARAAARKRARFSAERWMFGTLLASSALGFLELLAGKSG